MEKYYGNTVLSVFVVEIFNLEENTRVTRVFPNHYVYN